MLLTPTPFVNELKSVSLVEAGLFPGLPHETVSPNGTKRALTGLTYNYVSFDDFNLGYARFQTPLSDLVKAGPVNLIGSGSPGEAGYISRCLLLAVKATSGAGVYGFRVASSDGLRTYFRGTTVLDSMVQGAPTSAIWQSNLQQDLWYPLIVHQATANISSASLSIYWTPPGGVEALLPASAMSSQMHGGLFLVRFLDQDSVTRFCLCHKRYDGRALVLAYPLPASIWSASNNGPSHWPVSTTAGTDIYQVAFPSDKPNAQVFDWGSGWTRRPGPANATRSSVPTASMQPRITGY